MISFKLNFKTTPKDLYWCFLDEKKHSEFTGAKAKIDQKIGGKFSVWDGYASGENLELVENEKIVQSWRASDWDQGVYSNVTFIFKPNQAGTTLTFTQTGVPKEHKAEIKKGWEDYYWSPLKKYLHE